MKFIKVLNEVREAWAWVGIEPEEIVTHNEFGNLIIKDAEDKFWRLCPEDIYCKVVANSIQEYNELINDEEFVEDWFMATMVEEAKQSLGELKPDYKYHLSVPGALDGEYSGDNITTAPLLEMIRFSGDLGKRINELADGTEIKFKPIA